MTALRVTRIGPGVYSVDDGTRVETVYVAARNGERWAFWNGRQFSGVQTEAELQRPQHASHLHHVPQSLTAPMPATVIRVLVAPGSTVKKGDTVLLLEAMKMELAVRAPSDATVTAVNCREGELVQPETVLVELD